MEELFLGALLVRQELDVVDQQHIQRLVVVRELLDRVAAKGRHQILHELVGRDVADGRPWLARLDGIAHGLHQVGLAQTHTTVDEQRVVRTAWPVGHLQRGSPGQIVGLAVDEGLEGQPRIEPRAFIGHLATQAAKAACRCVAPGWGIEPQVVWIIFIGRCLAGHQVFLAEVGQAGCRAGRFTV